MRRNHFNLLNFKNENCCDFRQKLNCWETKMHILKLHQHLYHNHRDHAKYHRSIYVNIWHLIKVLNNFYYNLSNFLVKEG